MVKKQLAKGKGRGKDAMNPHESENRTKPPSPPNDRAQTFRPCGEEKSIQRDLKGNRGQALSVGIRYQHVAGDSDVYRRYCSTSDSIVKCKSKSRDEARKGLLKTHTGKGFQKRAFLTIWIAHSFSLIKVKEGAQGQAKLLWSKTLQVASLMQCFFLPRNQI